MNSLEECEEFINLSIKEYKGDVEKLKKLYSRFFDFHFILNSDGGGKTKLNKENLNINHTEVQKLIKKFDSSLDNILQELSATILSIMRQKGHFNRSLLNSLVYDDNNFFELLEMDLDAKSVPRLEKNKLLNILERLTGFKNRVYNLKYLIRMFDTSTLNKYINNFELEDLMNSKSIFETIDTYGLQNDELEKFEYYLKNFNTREYKTDSFTSLDYLLDYHKRRLSNYIYDGVKYKINLEYDNNIDLEKDRTENLGFIENIISNFIEQSCIDLIKKEQSKGKSQKLIEVLIQKNRNSFQIVVSNSGLQISDISSLYLSDTENRYIIESRNLAREMNARIDLETIEGSGMQYSLEF